MKDVRTIRVKTSTSEYDIYLGEKSLSTLQKRLKTVIFGQKSAVFVITSPEIWALWASKMLSLFADRQPGILFLPAGEKYKRFAEVEKLATQLSAAGADRKSILIALGGGVIGDVAGFLAAIFMRGIEYIQIPTTFLAQVDSSVGGKTGVNLSTGKNLIGAFYPPKAVIIDTEFLKTLPANQLRAGLFESIKAGLIRDAALFNLMESERKSILSGDAALIEKVITASVRMKARVVGEDERESGVRMILNFGHTIGHAIEAVSGFGTLLHGEAVGWGMLAAIEISRMRGLPQQDYARAVSTIQAYGLPKLPPVSAAKLKAAMSKDKKNSAGSRNFILIQSIGKAYVTDTVTDSEIDAAIAAILKPAGK
jgi:3-dehydroquinate synthase